MRKGVTRLGAAAVILIALVGAQARGASGISPGAAGPLREAANAVTFLDPAGDNRGGAPDLTSVRVSNDDAGMLEFQLVVPNRTDLRNSDVVTVYLDTDRSPGTGCQVGQGVGVDFTIRVGGQTAPVSDSLLLARHSGSCDPDFTSPQDSLAGRFDGATSALTVRVDRDEIGETRAFRFFVVAHVEPLSVDTWDPAGDVTPWVYNVLISPPRDTTSPRVKALPSTGMRGRTARLRFTVFEESGRAREELTILRGRRVLAKLRTPLGPRNAATIYTRIWRVPAGTGGGLRFCVLAWDAAGNRSAQSCARLRIR